MSIIVAQDLMFSDCSLEISNLNSGMGVIYDKCWL